MVQPNPDHPENVNEFMENLTKPPSAQEILKHKREHAKNAIYSNVRNMAAQIYTQLGGDVSPETAFQRAVEYYHWTIEANDTIAEDCDNLFDKVVKGNPELQEQEEN